MLTVALTFTHTCQHTHIHTHTCQHTHIHTRTHKCRSKILLLVNKNERLNLKKTPGCKRSAQAADKGLAAWLVDPLFRPTNANCCFANKTCWCWPNPCQNILLNSNYYFLFLRTTLGSHSMKESTRDGTRPHKSWSFQCRASIHSFDFKLKH